LWSARPTRPVPWSDVNSAQVFLLAIQLSNFLPLQIPTKAVSSSTRRFKSLKIQQVRTELFAASFITLLLKMKSWVIKLKITLTTERGLTVKVSMVIQGEETEKYYV
jgi:hypothetical protein